MRLLATITPRLGMNAKSYTARAPEKCQPKETETTKELLTDREASEDREEGGNNLRFSSTRYLSLARWSPGRS